MELILDQPQDRRTPAQRLKEFYFKMDPRIPVFLILLSYLILGFTVLGFNRTPLQALVTTSSALIFEVLLARYFQKKWIFPLSALITSLSLSFLLNYSHSYILLAVPVFFAIGSKYIFTFKGKHALNPAMMGVSLSLLFSHDLITAAPAYQWNGLASMSFFIVTLGLLFVIPKVNRTPLVLAFLITFTLQTALRSWIMKHHLPFETLFLGTLSSPSFFIFTFFMITDPATSPSDKKQQIQVGILLALVDLLLHLKQSYYTFFYAALIVGGGRLLWRHGGEAYTVGLWRYAKSRFFHSGYYRRPLFFGLLAFVGLETYQHILHPMTQKQEINFSLKLVDANISGLEDSGRGDLLDIVDPRVLHFAKWILSNGESASVGDLNNDGLQDLFLTNLLKTPEDRAQLFLGAGNSHFKKIEFSALREISLNPKAQGIISNSLFVDYDNDGDQDLLLIVAFGKTRLLQNQLIPHNKLDLVDVSQEVGLSQYTNAIGASFADFNKDGLLDLLVLNVWPEHLPDYETPHELNIFRLPKEAYDGDERPYNFMHDSWHLSNNGGENLLFLQTPKNQFVKQDSKAWGLPETRWSLAVGVADLNQDSWADIYVANDFGPDDLYFNVGGKSFKNHKGQAFGSIGRDTYKGMNVSLADFGQRSWLDVYVSNVHHALQAEGSLYWEFSKDSKGELRIEERATQKNILNETRFGWGAQAVDLNLDGWVDLIQANGMVDDSYDKKFEECPDYWYVNEKIARSPPSIHRYVHRWGDIRGSCIYGKEQNRIYINQGLATKPQFLDIATQVGVTHLGSSRGAIAADFSNHGRWDVLFTYPFESPKFYVNQALLGESKAINSWIGFELESLNSKCNREALGTQVILHYENETGPHQILLEKQLVSGFSGQGDRRLFSGLGRSPKNVRAQVDWCSGAKQEEFNITDLNQYLKLSLKAEVR